MIALAALAAAVLLAVILGLACGGSDAPWSDGRPDR